MRDLGQVLAHVHDAEIEIIEGDGPLRYCRGREASPVRRRINRWGLSAAGFAV
jgi:hypothetical protein